VTADVCDQRGTQNQPGRQYLPGARLGPPRGLGERAAHQPCRAQQQDGSRAIDASAGPLTINHAGTARQDRHARRVRVQTRQVQASGPAAQVPPCSAARSRMPISPRPRAGSAGAPSIRAATVRPAARTRSSSPPGRTAPAAAPTRPARRAAGGRLPAPGAARPGPAGQRRRSSRAPGGQPAGWCRTRSARRRAWMTITLRGWAMTSWNSRPTRACSSATARPP
jgi:hypothetical protein